MKAYDKVMLGNGVNLMLIPDQNYKSTIVSIYIKRPLSKKEATLNSLLPSVLKAATVKHPSPMSLAKAFQELYGSSMGVSVDKIGEKHIMSFRMTTAADTYLPEKIFPEALALLQEIILEPAVDSNGFLEEYVQVEKEILGEDIKSKINDKGQYAHERCVEIMCEGEPYAVSEDGYLEDLDSIDGKSLYQYYKQVMDSSPIDIVVAGNFNPEEVSAAVEKAFKLQRDHIIEIPKEEIEKIPEEKMVQEALDVSQGKLVMGLRTNISSIEDKYYGLLMFNTILGSGAHSKLFNNVREKHSLAYSIYSTMDRFKGLMFIQAGIETQNFEMAQELILKELRDVQEGSVTAEEFENSRQYLRNGLKSLKDSLYALSDFYYNQSLEGKNLSIEEMIERLLQVSMEDVVEAGQQLRMDTVYFLTSKASK